ncbi:DUF433 domain-containing protein [Candidatus Gottesmanbacteria bacterium]|nr:DUF433 domain-containing protein [Candidatus Gottesmanbacteria bacterium]
MKDMVKSDVTILRGKPVIAGTRIAVETILDLLAAGLTSDEVVQEYPGLTVESIRGAIAFASARVKREAVYPVVAKDGAVFFPSL